jgi:hypothetical protein
MATVEPIVADRSFWDFKTTRAVQVHDISHRRFADGAAVDESSPVFGNRVAVADREFGENVVRVLPVADVHAVDSKSVLKEVRNALPTVDEGIEVSIIIDWLKRPSSPRLPPAST